MNTLTITIVIILLLSNTVTLLWLVIRTLKNSSLSEDKKVELKASPLWLKVQETLITELKSEGNGEMDALLDKLEKLTITPEETQTLKTMLSSRWAEMASGQEAGSAYIMATIMDKVLAEADNKGKLVKVELVGESPDTQK